MVVLNYILVAAISLNIISSILWCIRLWKNKKKNENWEKIYPTFRQWALSDNNERKYRVFSINNNFVAKTYFRFDSRIELETNSHDNCVKFNKNWIDPFVQIRKYFKDNWKSISLKTRKYDEYERLTIDLSNMQLSRDELNGIFINMIKQFKNEFNWNLWMQ